MNLILTIPERVHLLNTIPQQGTVARLREFREVRELLSLTDAEVTAIGYMEVGGTVVWNAAAGAKQEPRTFELSSGFESIVKDALQAANKAGRLHLDLLGVFDAMGLEDK